MIMAFQAYPTVQYFTNCAIFTTEKYIVYIPINCNSRTGLLNGVQTYDSSTGKSIHSAKDDILGGPCPYTTMFTAQMIQRYTPHVALHEDCLRELACQCAEYVMQ